MNTHFYYYKLKLALIAARCVGGAPTVPVTREAEVQGCTGTGVQG